MNKKNAKLINIEWMPDKKSKVPLYKQISEYFKEKIISGQWSGGEKLPSQRMLSEYFKVNRSTISAAMDELSSYGIIESSLGGGTRICENSWSIMACANIPNWGKYIRNGQFLENVPIIQAINKNEYSKEMIRLGTGELSPEFYPKEYMNKVFSKIGDKITSVNYLEPLGLYELRSIISERMKKEGINTDPSSILITSGSLQAMHLLSVCILKRGSKVYTENLSYIKSLNVFQSAGLELRNVSMDKEGIEYYSIPRHKKEEAFSLLYTIPTFQNPTGIVMSEKRRRELYNFCISNRMPIIEDSAYSELFLNKKPPQSLKSMDRSGNVIYLGSISKTFAPGFRIGWLIGTKAIVERLGDAKMQMDYGASSIPQYVLLEFLKSGLYDKYLEDTRKRLKQRRDTMIKILDKYFKDIAAWNVPDGGFYIWLTFKKNINTEKLFNYALRENILINPGSVYGDSKKNSIRLSYSFEKKDNMKKGIKRLREIIDEKMMI